jgi:uncharacterized protein (TIGR02757 family)
MADPCIPRSIQENLDTLYHTYNRRELVHPDPLEFLYAFEDVQDREIIGLIASSLAYGRVIQILRSVSIVLKRMTPSPYEFIRRCSSKSLQLTFADFKHRFSTGAELASMLCGVKDVVGRHGSLRACFAAHIKRSDETVLPALCALAGELRHPNPGRFNSLLPCPSRGSACKRLNLFLRWMVRRDEVDPGDWRDVPPSMLVVPMDTHMHKIGLALGLTKRKQANLRAALDMTSSFKIISPDDPIRYDFALTRLGIRKDADLDAFLTECKTGEHRTHSPFETS